MVEETEGLDRRPAEPRASPLFPVDCEEELAEDECLRPSCLSEGDEARLMSSVNSHMGSSLSARLDMMKSPKPNGSLSSEGCRDERENQCRSCEGRMQSKGLREGKCKETRRIMRWRAEAAAKRDEAFKCIIVYSYEYYPTTSASS